MRRVFETAHQVQLAIVVIVVCALTAAGKNFLDRVSPDIAEAKTLFDQIRDAGSRANEVFENFLGLFNPDP